MSRFMRREFHRAGLVVRVCVSPFGEEPGAWLAVGRAALSEAGEPLNLSASGEPIRGPLGRVEPLWTLRVSHEALIDGASVVRALGEVRACVYEVAAEVIATYVPLEDFHA